MIHVWLCVTYGSSYCSEMLSKIGVLPQISARKQYKNAPNMFTVPSIELRTPSAPFVLSLMPRDCFTGGSLYCGT